MARMGMRGAAVLAAVLAGILATATGLPAEVAVQLTEAQELEAEGLRELSHARSLEATKCDSEEALNKAIGNAGKDLNPDYVKKRVEEELAWRTHQTNTQSELLQAKWFVAYLERTELEKNKQMKTETLDEAIRTTSTKCTEAPETTCETFKDCGVEKVNLKGKVCGDTTCDAKTCCEELPGFKSQDGKAVMTDLTENSDTCAKLCAHTTGLGGWGKNGTITGYGFSRSAVPGLFTKDGAQLQLFTDKGEKCSKKFTTETKDDKGFLKCTKGTYVECIPECCKAATAAATTADSTAGGNCPQDFEDQLETTLKYLGETTCKTFQGCGDKVNVKGKVCGDTCNDEICCQVACDAVKDGNGGKSNWEVVCTDDKADEGTQCTTNPFDQDSCKEECCKKKPTTCETLTKNCEDGKVNVKGKVCGDTCNDEICCQELPGFKSQDGKAVMTGLTENSDTCAKLCAHHGRIFNGTKGYTSRSAVPGLFTNDGAQLQLFTDKGKKCSKKFTTDTNGNKEKCTKGTTYVECIPECCKEDKNAVPGSNTNCDEATVDSTLLYLGIAIACDDVKVEDENRDESNWAVVCTDGKADDGTQCTKDPFDQGSCKEECCKKKPIKCADVKDGTTPVDWTSVCPSGKADDAHAECKESPFKKDNCMQECCKPVKCAAVTDGTTPVDWTSVCPSGKADDADAECKESPFKKDNCMQECCKPDPVPVSPTTGSKKCGDIFTEGDKDKQCSDLDITLKFKGADQVCAAAVLEPENCKGDCCVTQNDAGLEEQPANDDDDDQPQANDDDDQPDAAEADDDQPDAGADQADDDQADDQQEQEQEDDDAI